MARIVRGYSNWSMSRGWCCARDPYLASKKDGGGCQVTESGDDAHSEKTMDGSHDDADAVKADVFSKELHDWYYDKEHNMLGYKFRDIFPSPDTHLKCAEVLLTAKDQKVRGVELHYPDMLQYADVWMSNHVVDVNNCLLQWWMEH